MCISNMMGNLLVNNKDVLLCFYSWLYNLVWALLGLAVGAICKGPPARLGVYRWSDVCQNITDVSGKAFVWYDWSSEQLATFKWYLHWFQFSKLLNFFPTILIKLNVHLHGESSSQLSSELSPHQAVEGKVEGAVQHCKVTSRHIHQILPGWSKVPPSWGLKTAKHEPEPDNILLY